MVVTWAGAGKCLLSGQHRGDQGARVTRTGTKDPPRASEQLELKVMTPELPSLGDEKRLGCQVHIKGGDGVVRAGSGNPGGVAGHSEGVAW